MASYKTVSLTAGVKSWEHTHVMPQKRFAVPRSREELRQMKQLLGADEGGCEANRSKKRKEKILRKRLNPQL